MEKRQVLSPGFVFVFFLSELGAFAVSFDGLFENSGTVPGFIVPGFFIVW